MKAVIFLASSNAMGNAMGRPSFFESLEVQAVGIMVVLVALGLLALLVAIIERLLQQSHSKSGQDVRVTPSSRLAVAREADQVPEEVWAVIAASIFHTMGSTHRVLRVEPISNIHLQSWSVEGRRQIFQSHQLR